MEYNDAVPAHDLSLYVSLSLLSTMAIGLRLISRIKTKNALKGDDWWAFLSLILLQTFLGLSIWAMKKMKNIKNDESLAMFPENFNKVMYAIGPISVSTITAAKISIILLYRRVFLLDNSFRIASSIVGALCLLWGITFVSVLLFYCTPVEKFWINVPGSCVDENASFLGGEVLSCILDFAILLLPLRVIRKLKLPMMQKTILCFIFIMGSFIGVISIIRIARVYNGKFSYNDRQTNWLPIQLAMAVICCCLPTYRPLLPNSAAVIAYLVDLYLAIGSLILRKQRSARSSNTGSRSIDGGPCTRSRDSHYNNLTDHADESVKSVLTHVVDAEAGRMEDCVPGRDYPMDAINGIKTVDIV